MANNQYANKVQLADGTVLIDITADTVSASGMLYGTTAHDASGAEVTGTIPTKTASNVSISGTTVSIPSGYFASDATKEITGVTIAKPSSGTKTFSITVPNGESSTMTFVFSVNSSGDTVVTES